MKKKTKTKKAAQKENKKQTKYQRQITVRQWTTEPTDKDCVMLRHIITNLQFFSKSKKHPIVKEMLHNRIYPQNVVRHCMLVDHKMNK